MSILIKMVLTGLITVMAIPGLIVEPGPLSEIAWIGGMSAIWGLDWTGGD
jgi:hypothetical protein